MQTNSLLVRRVLQICHKVGGLCLLLLLGCNPYVTRSLNLISKTNNKDSVFVTYPIIETRRQATKDYFYQDWDALRPADSLTNKALHKLLDEVLPIRYANLSDYEAERKSKFILDSVTRKFLTTKHKHFAISQKLDFPTKANLILIPHLIWTRSTEDYDKGKCGKVGYRDYGNDKICTWTQSRTMILIINRKSKEVVYFRYSQWDAGTIFMPYEKRITLNFRHCILPLLKKLGKSPHM